MLVVLLVGVADLLGAFLLVRGVLLVGGGLVGLGIGDELVHERDDVVDDTLGGQMDLELRHDHVAHGPGIKLKRGETMADLSIPGQGRPSSVWC